MVFNAIVRNGAFQPEEPVPFKEGERVSLNVLPAVVTKSERRPITHEEAVRIFRELAAQSKPVTDGFCSDDHDAVLYSREAHP
jgi:predicted DNA-binding antitoxin AbrB/MazE fold protein